MPDNRPAAPKHPVVDERPAPPEVPERRMEEILDLPILDVAVPPRAPGALGLSAPGASLNDVLRYYAVVSEVLHAIQTRQASVKFRITVHGKKKNVVVNITDA